MASPPAPLPRGRGLSAASNLRAYDNQRGSVSTGAPGGRADKSRADQRVHAEEQAGGDKQELR